jgi:hypothetical protein
LFQSIDGRDPIDKLDKFNVNKIKPNAGNWGGHYEEYCMNEIFTSGWKLDNINVDNVDGIRNMDTNDNWLKLMNDTLKISQNKMIIWMK